MNARHTPSLESLLERHREGGAFPTYAELSALAAPAAPSEQAEPTVKQLAAQLDDDKPWTRAEQDTFAVFLARFPNESSQGIMSLGDAWKAGRAFEAADPAAPQAQALPERDPSKPAEQQGIFQKFRVQRLDGSDCGGGKHYGCRYFVLDLTHDQHAPAAMCAYAASCAATHPQLAADLLDEFAPAAPRPDQPEQLISILEEISVTDLAYKQRDLATKAIEILQQSGSIRPSTEPAGQHYPICTACGGKNEKCGHCDGIGYEPAKLIGYGECRCILSKYCDGTCNPIYVAPVEQAQVPAETSGYSQESPVAGAAPLPELTGPSIRDHADFVEDVLRLSQSGVDRKTLKAIRKDIYDTIDARVANFVARAIAASPPRAPAPTEAQQTLPLCNSALRAEPASQQDAGASGWQPIETAPRNGRTLLLGRFNSMGNWRTMRGQWFSAAAIAEDWEDPDDAEEGWYETAVEPDVPNCWSIAPTHWMPTPAAPEASPASRMGGITSKASAETAAPGASDRHDLCEKDGCTVRVNGRLQAHAHHGAMIQTFNPTPTEDKQ